jgi:hypothetical protein
MPRLCAQEHEMNKLKEQTGASLIEFVIVLIPFLVLMFASIEFAVACYNQAMLTNASREAARAGVVYNRPTPGLSDAEMRSIVHNYFGQHVISLVPPSAPVVSITPPDTATGDELRVEVRYTYGFFILPNLLPGFRPTIDLRAVSVMRME